MRRKGTAATSQPPAYLRAFVAVLVRLADGGAIAGPPAQVAPVQLLQLHSRRKLHQHSYTPGYRVHKMQLYNAQLQEAGSSTGACIACSRAARCSSADEAAMSCLLCGWWLGICQLAGCSQRPDGLLHAMFRKTIDQCRSVLLCNDLLHSQQGENQTCVRAHDEHALKLTAQP